MIKAMIIDDEEFVRTDVSEKIKKYFPKDIAIMTEASSVEEALKAIEIYEPGLLFLDIDLQDGTGFDILAQTKNKNFEVIFITGYDAHAIKAIKIGALDYILKPIDDDEFCLAVKKALVSKDKIQDHTKLVSVSQEYLNGAEKKRIILKTLDTLYAVFEDDIIYCRSDGNYTTFYTTTSQKILISKPLKHAEEILSEQNFIRCHQSYIVNKKHVIKYDKQGLLVVSKDYKVPVSGRRKEYTLQKIF